jgi:hypothetical protein
LIISSEFINSSLGNFNPITHSTRHRAENAVNEIGFEDPKARERERERKKERKKKQGTKNQSSSFAVKKKARAIMTTQRQLRD